MCSIDCRFPGQKARRISHGRRCGGYIANYSKGIPRLVNAVCDKALLAGFVEQRNRIDFGIVGRALRELEGQIES